MKPAVDAKTINLEALGTSLPRNTEIIVKPEEHDEERSARLKIERWEFVAGHAWTLGIVGLLIVVSVVLFGYVSDSVAKLAEWARTALSAIVTGAIAFFTGQKIGRSS